LPRPVQVEKPVTKKKVTGAAAAAQQAARGDSPSGNLLRKATSKAMKSLKSPATSGRMGKKNVARKAPQKSTVSEPVSDEDEDMEDDDEEEDEEDKDVEMDGKAKIVTVSEADGDVAAPSNPLAAEQ
jgi:hypothetical protein